LRLQKEHRTYEEAAKQVDYLQKRLEETREERNRLQREFDTITRQPFFKRESDQASFKRITELQAKIDERDRSIRDAKESVLRSEEQLKSLNTELKEVRGERELANEEIDRLKNQLDPNAMSLADIQKKIHDLDPSMFR
jgi:chromosome segregation ATPase